MNEELEPWKQEFINDYKHAVIKLKEVKETVWKIKHRCLEYKTYSNYGLVRQQMLYLESYIQVLKDRALLDNIKLPNEVSLLT